MVLSGLTHSTGNMEEQCQWGREFCNQVSLEKCWVKNVKQGSFTEGVGAVTMFSQPLKGQHLAMGYFLQRHLWGQDLHSEKHCLIRVQERPSRSCVSGLHLLGLCGISFPEDVLAVTDPR